MKKFLDDNFFLSNKTAEHLYHEVARDLRVVDYHNHLNPVHLAENRHFENLASLWINEDPYKHRAMRIHGIAEEGITGAAPDEAKYANWVSTFPKTIGNPLFHWSCLELKRMFGIDAVLCDKNAADIWNTCNGMLQQEGFGALDMLRKWNTEIVCTSDDLTGNLQPHQTVAHGGSGIQVLPSLRGDSILAFDASFPEWMEKLSGSSAICTLDEFKEAIIRKLDHFAAAGCRLADHSLDAGFVCSLPSEAAAIELFAGLRKGAPGDGRVQLRSHMLVFLGAEYRKRGWTLQLHIGAQRTTSSRLRRLAGPAGGYATIGNGCDIASLCLLLDTLEQKGGLPRTILYTLNPADYAAFATLTGSYAQDGKAGLIQFGPAWWYNDHYEGIRQHLITLSGYGLLSHFIGMTTDSRSILSFSRHEYFRRILCNQVGIWAEAGELPDDGDVLSQLVRDICYNNSKQFIFNS